MKSFEETLNTVLVDTFKSIRRYEEKVLRSLCDVSITLGEMHLIESIKKLGEQATISAIALYQGISLPSVTVGVKKLESKALIAKKRKKDGRSSMIELTEKGEEIAEKHASFHQRLSIDIGKGLNITDKESLLVAMTRINEFFNQTSFSEKETMKI